jgi:hypothetical protein
LPGLSEDDRAAVKKAPWPPNVLRWGVFIGYPGAGCIRIVIPVGAER